MIMTLEEAKEHMKIDLDFKDDDNNIKSWILAVEEYIAQYLKYDSLEEAFPDGNIPYPVKHAAKMLVATYDANRETVSFVSPSKIPFTVDSLLAPYVRYYEKKKEAGT